MTLFEVLGEKTPPPERTVKIIESSCFTSSCRTYPIAPELKTSEISSMDSLEDIRIINYYHITDINLIPKEKSIYNRYSLITNDTIFIKSFWKVCPLLISIQNKESPLSTTRSTSWPCWSLQK